MTTDLLSKWATVGRRGRVLAVIDVSGSMAARVRGPTRLELAVSAASRALGTFAPDSDIGLWAFSINLGKGKDHRELLSTAPLASERSGTTQRKAALQALARLAPKRGGGTGLYDTVLAAFREAQRSYSAGRLNAVVLLTDGRNDDDKSVGRAGMLRALKKESDPERPVRAITPAYGENADVKLLRAVSDATRCPVLRREGPQGRRPGRPRSPDVALTPLRDTSTDPPPPTPLHRDPSTETRCTGHPREKPPRNANPPRRRGPAPRRARRITYRFRSHGRTPRGPTRREAPT